MKKLFLLIVLFVFAGVTTLLAQTRVITGTVTSAVQGEGPIPGVTVMAKGTTIGALTDLNGRYSVTVPTTATTLVFSYVGYVTQEAEIAGRTVIDIVMESSIIGLQEVIVTSGYGIRRTPKSSSALTQVVSGDKLAEVRQINVNNAIAGKVTGIQFRGQSAAALGRTGDIRLRGDGGFGTGSGILYVVDGTILPNSNDINLDDVEDVSVLSGPAASAILGSQGANGAIIITTKKARISGGRSMGVEVNAGVLASSVYILPNYQNDYAGGNVYDMYKYTWQTGDPEHWKTLDGKYYPDYSDDASWGPRMVGQEYIPWYAWYEGTQYTGKTAKLVPQPDNARDFYDTGWTWNNNVAFSKVGDGYNIRAVVGNIHVKGNIPTTNLSKTTLALKTSYDLTKRLTFGANVNFFTTYTQGEFDDGYSNQTTGSFNQWFHRDLDMNLMRELKDLRTPDGIWASWNHNNPSAWNPAKPLNFYGGNYWFNFYKWFDLVKMPSRADRLFGDVSLTYKIIEGLTARVTYRRQQNNTWSEQKFWTDLIKSSTQASGNEGRVKGYYSSYTSYSNRENIEAILNFTRQVGDFRINANAGSDFFNYIGKSNSANTVNGLNIDNLFTIANSKDQPSISNSRSSEQYKALFLRGDVGYKDFVFAEFTLRNDWFSVLPPDNSSILSKSFGGSFVFSDLLKLPFLSFGKLRAAWGEIPTAIGIFAYPGFAYGVGQYQWTGNFLMGTPDQLVDPNIHGAVKTQKEIGLELRFLDNRLGMTATYWDGTEKDIPLSVSIANYSGFSSKLLNTGEIAKQGFDMALNLKPLTLSNVSWDFNATFAYLIKNEVVKIAEGINQIVAVDNLWDTPNMVHAINQPWGELYGSGMVMHDGKPVLNDDGSYVVEANKYFGNVLPKYTGGIQNSVRFLKNFTFIANLDYQVGGKFFSLSDMWGTFSGLTAKTSGLNDKGNPIRDPVIDGGGVHIFGVVDVQDYDVNPEGSPIYEDADFYVDAQTYYHNFFNLSCYDEFIYDLSYVKLRELSIGYTIPIEKISGLSKYIQGATISLVAQNPWLIYSSTKDFDPSEISSAQGESGQFPGIRSFGMNIKLNF
ncbi:MAG: SusC/RagA family TonB-linked outer membrane protein [Bacteroidales bacterium]|nr:SusC/RagA family TonB-linked outer membrane protein [Bacteroidales bacterium]